ncbi:MAG: exodeoxyribonuclease V subunit gamma, partial [Leptospiraceae bacterium]|nr:exodeoxyribonuclease V subunit gamma [Leptospiraceae bacterium]
MGVRIHFSDLPGLSDALLTALESQTDPFLAPHVLVPNRNLRRWLQMQIAARNGIAANIKFEYLEQGLVGILRNVVPHVQLADPASIQWSLLRALEATSEGSDSIDQFRKASRYSYLFRDYEYHRNRTVRQWQAELESTLAPSGNLDIFDFDERVSESEGHSWQKSLYQAMLSILHERGMHTLTELGCATLEGERIPAGAELHIFGLSRMSRLHISILFRLALQRDVHIYLFDVFGPSIPSADADGEIHPALKAVTERDYIHIEANIPDAEYSFQKDGLELIYLFQKGAEFLNNHGAEARWFRHRCAGQDGILGRLNGGGPSVELVEAPGIRREIESIADHIQMQLARDPTLQPEQIGILVPTMHRYRSHFEYVFRSRNKIPFNLTDFSARETSRLGEALRAMLRFDQPLDRRTVFQLLSNRAVRTRWNIQEEDFRRILEVCDQLNLFRGIEDSAFPVHGWEHGLRRLRLGSIMAVQEPFLGYLPADAALTDADLLALFGQFLDTLEGYRRRLRSGEEPFAVIRQMVDALVNMEELRGETAIYMALLESVESGQRAAAISPIDAMAAREWIMDSLNEVAGGIGEYLIQGVTISALQPMRPIPFRRLYIAGLKEGDFPGFPVMHPEDLRADFRLPGDSSLPDGNRFLFLEALASCSERIVLSYVR